MKIVENFVSDFVVILILIVILKFGYGIGMETIVVIVNGNIVFEKVIGIEIVEMIVIWILKIVYWIEIEIEIVIDQRMIVNGIGKICAGISKIYVIVILICA